ncbi:MAG: COG4315 family predicted lipoprotein [Candidatus Limnocylindrales bacterium]
MYQPSIRAGARSVAWLVLVAALAAACSSAATAAPTQPPAASTPPAASAPAASAATGGVVVNMATTTLGPVLVGPNGLTLYTHTGDSATSSTCTGGCATAWPPLAVATGSAATGGTGVSGTFATLTRDDGTLQVTYNGLPLYGWKNDAKAGDTTGQGVNGFSVAKP